MSERDEFLGWVETRLHDAELAMHNGDTAPRAAIWSAREPVSVLGAWQSAVGQQAVSNLFRDLEATFTDCTSFVHEVVTAEVQGDIAYTAGYEHTTASVNGEPRTYTLRVTQVYRREDGDWRVAHRHADTVPES